MGNAAVLAVAGGTVFEQGGGKFANGAQKDIVHMGGMCESDGGSCSYREQGIEDRPEGLTLGRKWCSYTCTVTFSSEDGKWSEPLTIKIKAPGEIGYSHDKNISWNDKQGPRGGREVLDSRFSSGLIKVLVTNPFPVSTHFGPSHIVQPILEELKK